MELIPVEQKEMYDRALWSLERAGKTAEHTKVATLPEEIEIMKSTSRVATATAFQTQYRAGQFELIFKNPLARSAYIINHDTGRIDDSQVWTSPQETVQALQKGEKH
jgi:hypothetical protein